MNAQVSRRSAVFLDEMGVGVQWRLRDRPASQDDADATAAVTAPEPAPAPREELSPPVVMTAPPTPAVTEAVEAAAAVPPPAAPKDEANAWFDDAPAVAPAHAVTKTVAPARPPAAPAVPVVSDESTAWFDDVPAAPVAAAGVAAPARQGPVSDDEIAVMDWTALRAAVSSCTRCGLCQGRQAAVPGRGADRAEWLVLATAPNADDEAEGMTISGAPGQLLDNMLKAVKQSTEDGAYLTTLVKCRPVGDDGSARLPSAAELNACRPYLERELELSGAHVLLALGHTAGKGLLGGAARGRIMQCAGVPVVATYHPADLLQKPEDKAKAWSDLCLAKAAHAGRR
jgi:uracil-DNA glycosylase family 4